MKTPNNSTVSHRGHNPQLKIFGLALLAGLPILTAPAQNYWQGPANGTNDFNIAANWVGSAVPTGSAANPANDNGSNSVILIQTGDPTWSVNSVRAGWENNDSGSYLQSGGTVTTVLKFRLAAGNSGTANSSPNSGSAAYYTLNGGTINCGSDFNIGELGTATLNVNGGVINVTGNFGDNNYNGAGNTGVNAVTDVVNQTAGVITGGSGSQLFVGNGGAAIYNMSGGTNIVSNYIAFGRSGGNGTFNMTGGLLVQNGGGNLLVGTGYQNPSGGTPVGVLNQSGGIIKCTGQFLVPETSPAVGTANLSGSAVLNAHDWIAIGRSSGVGTLNITNNAIITRDNNNDSGAHLDVGAGGTGTVNQNGGFVTNLTATVYIGETAAGTWNLNSGVADFGAVAMDVNAGAHGTLNLNGGLLQISGISSPNSGSTLYFNGSTVQAVASSVSFISGVTLATIGTGGVVFDSQAYNITIPEEMDDNGGGALTKIGSGTLTLTGPNTYNGATLVNAGTLAVNTASTVGSGGYSVAAGAAFSVQVAPSGGQFTTPSFAFASGASTLDVDLNTFGLPSSAPLNAGALTVNGTVTLNVLAEAPVGIGAVPLVQYSSLTGSGNFVLGSVPSGETGYLTNDGVSTISLVITSAGAPRWNGNVSGIWDINATANWIDVISGNPTTYHNAEPVLFDDTATGTTNVVLNATVTPASLTFNDSVLSYNLTGTGVISGTTSLTKEGTGTLALLNSSNSYTGQTILLGGILSVTNLANGGSASAIGASAAASTNLEMAGGMLSYTGPAVSINRGYDIETNSVIDAESNLAFGGVITTVPGAGFTKVGPAQLTYNAAGVNALSGSQGYNVLGGTVLLTGSGAGETNAVAGHLLINGTNGVPAAVVVSNAVLTIQGSTTNGQALGSGMLVINSGGAVSGSGTIDLGDGGSTGAITQTGGTVNSSGQMWIGEGNSGVGSYTLSSGTLTMANWLAIGRAGGVGTFNLSGNGVVNDIGGGGGNIDIGNSGGLGGVSGTGILNQTGGTITNTATQTWLGEGSSGQPASGTWNISGGTAWLGQLDVGQGGTGTSAVNISGTGSITCTGYVDLAPAAAATGNLNINGGSLTANGDMAVADLGTAVLNMVTNGGGVLTVHGTLYLSRNSATASGTVNLNAGSTIVAGFINNGYGFGHSLTNNPQSFNFNGGTLEPYVASPYFIQPYVNAVVQAGGAVINDNGLNITVLAALVDGGGGGGLTKQGSGTLYLAGVNTYTGPTTVSTGTFGNSGVIAGPVTVAAGATLAGDTGSIGNSTINNTLTLAAGSTTVMKITPASNDEIQGMTSVTYGGALVVTNAGGALTGGSVYQLFHAASPGSGNFSSVTLLPGGAATFNPVTGLLTIAPTAPPTLNGPVLSGGNLILTGSGGLAGGNYDIITSTNLLTPLAGWTTNVSGSFSASGTFSNNIPVSASQPAQFFRLAP